MESLAERITAKDLTLFDPIESQSTPDDKRSLLAIHAALRDTRRSFSFLEIGSHLGGSMQVFAADSACERIFSIDPRPTAFPDERGIVSRYPDNSTQRMLELLSCIPNVNLSKIVTCDKDTSTLEPDPNGIKYDFCFIDGEHTDIACERDAMFCLRVLNEDGCIAFHDANVVFRGIANFLTFLQKEGKPFRAHLLPDAVFAVQLGQGRLFEHSSLSTSIKESWKGYIQGMSGNEWYRAALNKPLFKFLRRIRFVRRIFVVKGIAAQPI